MMVVNTITLSVDLEIKFFYFSQNTLMKKVPYGLIRLSRQSSGLEAINLIFT